MRLSANQEKQPWQDQDPKSPNQAASNQAATTVGIMQLYSTSPAAIAAAAQAANSSFTSQLAAVAQLMNALRHWRG
ncbi:MULTISPECIES: hypothetical protein [Burkholderia cepacia complex]|uniref:hypothetical protein n=1 Tax=Burkholderia cepacia complex TaxID=87882 RepID=UPI000A8EBF63|nr:MULTISPECIES: hypothetical protein [Burkholderia cepacia complex]